MARITTGYTFGLNAKQAKAACLMAEGAANDELVTAIFGETKDAAEFARAVRQIKRWQTLPGFMDCYRAHMKTLVPRAYGKAMKKIEKQMDSKNEWVAQGAAREILTRMEKVAMGLDSNEVVVRIEGMPELGVPEDEADE